MDRSVKRYKERRDKRIEEKNGTRYDSVDAFRARRLKRLQARFDANPQIAYGIAKGMGIDTTGMGPKEVWEAIRKEGGGRGGVNGGKKPNTTNAPSTASNRGHISGVSAKAAKEAGYVGGWLPPKVQGMKDAETRTDSLERSRRTGLTTFSRSWTRRIRPLMQSTRLPEIMVSRTKKLTGI